MYCFLVSSQVTFWIVFLFTWGARKFFYNIFVCFEEGVLVHEFYMGFKHTIIDCCDVKHTIVDCCWGQAYHYWLLWGKAYIHPKNIWSFMWMTKALDRVRAGGWAWRPGLPAECREALQLDGPPWTGTELMVEPKQADDCVEWQVKWETRQLVVPDIG